MYYILVLFVIIRLAVCCNMITDHTIFYSYILKGIKLGNRYKRQGETGEMKLQLRTSSQVLCVASHT
jgi:hypothetical protein